MERAEYERMYQLEDAHWWFVNRRRLATVLLQRQVGTGSLGYVLDVGCGTGGNLEFLAVWGQVVGIDLSPVALSLACRRRLSRLAEASSLALPFAGNTFALVTAFDVLYHRWIINDTNAIRECYRVLRPLGWLLLTDSALPGLWSRHDEVYYARQRYLLPDIGRKLIEAGFEVNTCSYRNALLLPVLMMVRLVMRWFSLAPNFEWQRLPAWLNRLLIVIHKVEEMWLRRGGTMPIGSSLICLVQKPLL